MFVPREVIRENNAQEFKTRYSIDDNTIKLNRCYNSKGKGTRYLTWEVPLLSREYSPRKPTVRSFYPPLSISAPF